jgi:putative transposase
VYPGRCGHPFTLVTRHRSPVQLSRSGCRGDTGKTFRIIGYPKVIRLGNGSEFISRDVDLWACQRGVTLDFLRSGKPTDNAFIEAFNSKLRTECLNAHWFLSLQDACEKLEDWRRYYNEERPHSTIGTIPPIMLVTISGETSPPALSNGTNPKPSWPNDG